MDKRLAQELLLVFDSPYAVEVFQKYMDAEIAKAFSMLKGVSDPIGIYRLQGQIAAYETLKKVRDTAITVAKGE